MNWIGCLWFFLMTKSPKGKMFNLNYVDSYLFFLILRVINKTFH